MHADQLIERLLTALRPFEFTTFLLGFERPADYHRASHEAQFRPLKAAIGRELERCLQGVEVDFHRPDVRVEIGAHLEVRVRPAPIFLAGRYRKLSRQIPASRWVHHACRGLGCPTCSHSGSLCGPSIQELISGPVLASSGGLHTLFHALGREDTDARMLGHGRPFVIEVHRPVRRTLPLESIRERFSAAASERAELLSLAQVDGGARAAVKSATADKTYRAWIEAGGPVPRDARGLVAAMAGSTVAQLSPARVMHRRGRGTRRLRAIIESEWIGEVEGRQVWELRVESGTYVKELVNGDGGRTRPSLAEVLGIPCSCVALDVLAVHWQAPWEA